VNLFSGSPNVGCRRDVLVGNFPLAAMLSDHWLTIS
jgi:hypothetical protein